MAQKDFYLKVKNLKKEKKEVVRVGVVQFELNNNFYREENKLFYPKSDKVKTKFKKFLKIAKKKKINILCFPELSVTENISKELQNFANENKVIIIGGSYYNKERKNVCPILIPNEKYIYYTEKINLSPFEKSSRKDKGAVKGDKVYVIKNSKFGSFAVLICLDFLDNELKNRIYKEDIDFLFVVSLNRDWERFLILMNQDCINNKKGVYIIYSNSILKRNSKIIGDGKSAIFGIMNDLYLDKDEHIYVKYKLGEIYDEY